MTIELNNKKIAMCPECKKELSFLAFESVIKDSGVFENGDFNPDNYFLCEEPDRTSEDLKGKNP